MPRQKVKKKSVEVRDLGVKADPQAGPRAGVATIAGPPAAGPDAKSGIYSSILDVVFHE